jgi:hypothetical protein
MSDKTAKALRKSVRNVVQELLPEILNSEMVDAIKSKLSQELGLRMDVIAKDAQKTLSAIDERQKDFQNFLLRQAVAAQSPAPELGSPEALANDNAQVETPSS